MISATPSCLRIEVLTFHDQFILWSTRNWVMASSRRPTMPTVVKQAFAVAGAVDAADDLHDLLAIITTTASRIIHFKPTGCPTLSSDEARFLTLMTAARCETCDADTLALFEDWLPPAAARLAVPPARRLAWVTFDKLGSPSAAHAHLWRMDQTATVMTPDPGGRLTH